MPRAREIDCGHAANFQLHQRLAPAALQAVAACQVVRNKLFARLRHGRMFFEQRLRLRQTLLSGTGIFGLLCFAQDLGLGKKCDTPVVDRYVQVWLDAQRQRILLALLCPLRLCGE